MVIIEGERVGGGRPHGKLTMCGILAVCWISCPPPQIDSCCGNQDHAVAFSDYAKFRDAMNATGKQVWFSLCGWEAWYSPPDPSLNYLGGGSLGNSWRIAGDGSGWGPLTNCLNTQAGAAPYVGLGAWADPDLLIGPQVYVGGQSDQQARAQFTMWSLAPTNLLISQNVLAWSDYAMETYSNSELVGINQDPLGSAARRIVGGDLSFPCGGGAPGALASVVAADCKATDVSQQWDIDAATGEIKSRAFPGGVLDAFQCGTADGTVVSVFTPDSGKGSCAGKNQRWKWNNGGSVTNDASGACLDIFDWVGPTVDTWTCNGGTNQVRGRVNGVDFPVVSHPTRHPSRPLRTLRTTPTTAPSAPPTGAPPSTASASPPSPPRPQCARTCGAACSRAASTR